MNLFVGTARQSDKDTMRVIKGYIALMKPRIIELLLITTVPAMIVAKQGIPNIGLILVTLIGGTLSAGGGQRSQHVG